MHGVQAYNDQVKFLTSLPFVHVLEWVFIFIPLLYHGLYGLWIWYRGDSNVGDYPWTGNWLYTAQRWTGIITLLYIAYHVIDMRFTGVHLMGGGYNVRLFQGLVGVQRTVGGSVIRCRHRCCLMALLVRRVAVCREVGLHGR